MKRIMNTNFVSGIIFLIVSIGVLVLLPAQIDTMENGPITAQTIPGLLAKVVLVCSIYLIGQGIFDKKNKPIIITSHNIKRELRSTLMVAIYAAYAVLIPLTGFLIASLLLAIGLLAFYKIKIWYYYAIACSIVLLVYFVFEKLLFVKFPGL